MFALGCFWGPDVYFSKLPGVLKTTVGYSGGEKENPTYEALDDHTETVEIEYDPETVSYEELLHHFWNQHDPTAKQKTQYQSIIFYHDAEQRKAVEESKRREAERRGKDVVTEIRPAGKFYRAEEYHQKYYQKHGIV